MSKQRVAHAGLSPVSHQKITTNSTAQAVNSTTRQADVLLIGVETNSVRFRLDAAATSTTGVLLTASNSPYIFYGWNRTSIAVFAKNATAATIQVSSFTER
jgi:RNA:NAD 2'-phosphotransferase (TPT1/KptA family)